MDLELLFRQSFRQVIFLDVSLVVVNSDVCGVGGGQGCSADVSGAADKAGDMSGVSGGNGAADSSSGGGVGAGDGGGCYDGNSGGGACW